jgi:ubiquinone/menaquinone biosynthesis C-methylase UbiE
MREIDRPDDRRMPDNFERYQRIATFYDWLDLPFEYGCYRRLRPFLFHGLAGRILEAGVGTGRNFPFYPPGSHVVGIDLSPAMLARAERRISRATASVELRQMDVATLDFPNGSFDGAVAAFLFCVLPQESQATALKELGRVVRPGGRIRILSYVRPRGAVRGTIARLWEPFVDWAFSASFDRRTEEAITAAELELVESRYVVTDLIKLLTARVAPR